jgi:hypothetical protein
MARFIFIECLLILEFSGGSTWINPYSISHHEGLGAMQKLLFGAFGFHLAVNFANDFGQRAERRRSFARSSLGKW